MSSQGMEGVEQLPAIELLPIKQSQQDSLGEDIDVVSNPPYGVLLSLNPLYDDIVLTESEVILGRRKAECDVVFPDITVSGKHCIIRKDREGIIVEDVSTNGTYIDRARLLKKSFQQISNGQEITLVLPRSRHQLMSSSDLISFVFRDTRLAVDVVPVVASDESGVLKHLQFVSKLGAGSFGTVWKAVCKKRKLARAVKIVSKKRFLSACPKIDKMFAEVEVLSQLSHPHIVQVSEVFNTANDLLIVLELATGGDLEEYLKASGGFLAEAVAKSLFHQILAALSYLQSANVAHRDLKPENIMLQFQTKPGEIPHLKITDFGLARVFCHTSAMSTMCGTPLYVAPEILRGAVGAPGHKGYDTLCDMWSAGILLHQMLTGAAPFVPSSPLHSQILQALEPRFRFQLDKKWACRLSPLVHDLLQRLITAPAKRLSAAKALEHPWFTEERAKRKRVVAFTERTRTAVVLNGSPRPAKQRRRAMQPDRTPSTETTVTES